MKVIVFGGDGFCGWPTCLRLSHKNCEVTIIDNLSHRRIDVELGVTSLTPIASLPDRLAAWRRLTGKTIGFRNIDVAQDYDGLKKALADLQPDAVVHFAEQRSAPYSMRNAAHKRYTIDNNINATHNLLVALVDLDLDVHLVHLGTMGVYGYDGDNLEIPEGYLDVSVTDEKGQSLPRSVLYPTQPGSVYHLSKSMDQLMFQFYARNDRLRITDLHQGIVWGTQTEETGMADELVNRFDYDGDYGTVLNRFLVQAVTGHPLTVYGTGGQTRGFINIQDTVRCVALALANPPQRGDRVRIINQLAETRSVREIAERVAGLTGATIANVDNPRKEAESNPLRASNATFRALGLNPVLLSDAMLEETLNIVERFKGRYDANVVAARSLWTRENRPGVLPAASADHPG